MSSVAKWPLVTSYNKTINKMCNYKLKVIFGNKATAMAEEQGIEKTCSAIQNGEIEGSFKEYGLTTQKDLDAMLELLADFDGWGAYWAVEEKKDAEPEIKKKVHNIVASTILAPIMRYIKSEFMLSIRGYLCSKPEDDQIFIKVERAAREAIEKVLLENV